MPTTPQTWSTPQQVNIDTDAVDVKVASLANGNFVVLWRETDDTGAGAEVGNSIIGRIYDPLGNPIGGEFLAAPGGIGDNGNFEARALPDGGFVIVCEADFSGSGKSIMATELTSTGDQVDTKQIAENSSSVSIADPTVSVGASGDYFVSYQQIVGNGGMQTIMHRVDSGVSGQVSDPARLTNVPSADATEGAQETTSAILTDGTIVVIGNKTANQQNTQDGLQIRFVESETGTVLGSAMQVPLTGINDATDTQAHIAALSTGGFVVTWRSQNDITGDVVVRFQTYDESRVPQSNGTAAFLAGDDYRHPQVVALGGGAFFVAAIETTAQGDVVVGQMIGASGTPIGTPQTLSPIGASVDLLDLDLTRLEDGRFTVSYTEQSNEGAVAQMVVYDPRVSLIDGHYDDGDVITAGLGATIVRGDGAFGDVLGGGDDTLYAYGVGDQLMGQRGDDLLVSGGGADTLNGGTGHDTASFAEHTQLVRVSLTSGIAISDNVEDKLISIENVTGTAFDDSLFGDSNDNRLVGRAGDDYMTGQDGQDQIYGGNGDDFISGGDGNDIVRGGAGPDHLKGGFGDDSINGGQGLDWLRFEHSDVGATIDLADTNAQDTGHGQDTIINIEYVWGTDADDVFRGDSESNILLGKDGDDNLHGRAGHDNLYGGHGNDIIRGGSGNDKLTGNDGDDKVIGGKGHDTFYFGTVDGSDSLFGGAGNDTYVLFDYSGDLTVVENKDNGVDTVEGHVDIDLRNVSDHIERLSLKGDLDLNGFGNALNNQVHGNDGENDLRGFSGDDQLQGRKGHDKLAGGSGKDRLSGGRENDVLLGDAGQDVLIGGQGDDRLVGGAQADTFVFNDGFGNDTIADFNVASAREVIDLSGVTGITGFNDLMANHIYSNSERSAVITDGSHEITLQNVKVADLSIEDFIF